MQTKVNSQTVQSEHVSSLTKQIHDLRLVNMDLRHEQSKLRAKLSNLTEENKGLRSKVDLQDKKNLANCKAMHDS